MGLHDKAPKYGTITPFHQDNYYSCLKPPYFVTCYVALDAQSSENGGISYVKGSHLGGVLPHVMGTTKAFSSALADQKVDETNLYRPGKTERFS
jgi:phytanoyl-CoA hydroxylase